MKKNVKGFIGLFSAIFAIILGIAVLCVPTEPIRGTSVSLHGVINITLALVAAGLGVLAIVFGILAVRETDKKGPRKAGIIAGVFAILIGLSSAGICALTKTIVDYANDVPGNALSQSLDTEQRQEIDNLLKQLRESFDRTSTIY